VVNLLGIIAAILAGVVVAIIIGSIWAQGISSTTWEEIEYFKKTDETE
jgi:hypothetical protein